MAASAAAAAPSPPVGNVARLTARFEQGGEGTPPASAAHARKKQRVEAWEGVGAAPTPSGASASQSRGEAMAGRRLWPPAEAQAAAEGGNGGAEGAQGDEAAREARLQQIRAKFGTKVFHAPKQLAPSDLLAQLGAAESDLAPDDYVLHRWEPMPLLLNTTSNAHCKNFVLKGLSGCVALASSMLHLFVLGAGETIWIADADAVKAQRSEEGLSVRFGEGDFLALRTPDEATSAAMISLINARAAKRAELRKKEAAAGSKGKAAGANGEADAGPPAAGAAAGTPV